LIVIASTLINHLPLPALRWQRPVLVGLFGLPGSGKSEIARYLANHLPLVVLATDAIRLRRGLPSGPATHSVTFEVSAVLLRQSFGIVWDGLHLRRTDRVRFREFAKEHGAHCVLIQASASDEILRRRLASRIARPDETVAQGKFVITPEHFDRIAFHLEPPLAEEDILTVDTSEGAVDQKLVALVADLRTLIE
jgi:predicted kinase